MKKRSSRSGGFSYDSASNPLASVGNSRYVWATVGISSCNGRVRSYKNLPAVAYRAKALGKSHGDGRDMPKVAPTITRIATVGKVEAESWQNPQNLDNQFSHRWMWYATHCRFKTTDF
jgi:hypothetical protein